MYRRICLWDLILDFEDYFVRSKDPFHFEIFQAGSVDVGSVVSFGISFHLQLQVSELGNYFEKASYPFH
jgi:hypothetical protein